MKNWYLKSFGNILVFFFLSSFFCRNVFLQKFLMGEHEGTSTDATPKDVTGWNDYFPRSTKGFRPVYIYSRPTSRAKVENKSTFSQAKQDLMILSLTGEEDKNKKSRQKYFVDLAANDAQKLSNTLLLEQNGWKGLCIEPNSIYWYHLASVRTCTVIGAFVGGNQEDDGLEIDVELTTGVMGGIVGEKFDNKKASNTNEKRNLVSLLTVFQETRVPVIVDYLSLDVEGAESLVLEDFPWKLYNFKFITVERPKVELIEMLHAHGYEKATDITFWGETLWFNKDLVSMSKDQITETISKRGLECYRCIRGEWDASQV